MRYSSVSAERDLHATSVTLLGTAGMPRLFGWLFRRLSVEYKLVEKSSCFGCLMTGCIGAL